MLEGDERHASGVIVGAPELRARLAEDHPPVLLDVRWGLGLADGHLQYVEGHIPGAVYVDLDAELAGPPSPADGRHPLPSLAVLQTAARRWGITADSSVVAYDDAGNLAAARAWWLLLWAGLTDVQLLDGGLGAWRRAGYELETGEITPCPGDVSLSAGHLPVLDADDAARLAEDGTLLDARAAERFRGELEPIDPIAGHIPGAVNAPTTDNLREDGAFAPAGELAARFRALGVDGTARLGVYCGSGVTAAHEVAALAIAGIDIPPLYVGSWSQWSNDPARPIAVGD
jgi:thiosulfate/3-mercaptopyruvate sulfurtransferase